MSACIRRAGDSVADWLKDLGFTQVGNDQSEQQALAAMRYAAHVGSRTGNSIHEATLLKFAQRCGVSRSFRALRTLGTGIAQLVTNTDPRDQLVSVARYTRAHEPSNAVGVHIYSFGGAVRAAAWMRERL